MKHTNIKAFEKHLLDAGPGHLAGLYLVVCKDAYVRNGAVKSIIKAFGADEQGVQTFQGDQSPLGHFLGEVNTVSLFSRRRCLVMHNVDSLSKGELEKLDPVIAKLPKDTCVIFAGSAVSGVTSFYKKCEKAGVICDLPEEKAWEKEKNLHMWLIAEAGQLGKKFDPYAAQNLVKQAGTDQSSLYQELQKLICYVGMRPEITAQDVKAICSVVNVENIWQLGEALFRRDAATALRISKAILDDGTALLALLKQLRSQFETDFQISCMLSQGATSADITQKYPYMRGTILEKHLQAARSYGRDKFKEGLLHIDAAELKAKNSVDNHLINELLILKLTA